MRFFKTDSLIKRRERKKRRFFLKKIFLSLPVLGFFSIRAANSNEILTSKKLSSASAEGDSQNNSSYLNKGSQLITLFLEKMSKNDGFKYIGSCPDVKNLRQTAPEYAGQEILLKAYYGDKISSGGGFFFAIPNTGLNDDGGIIFKVDDKWCWKRIYSSEINAEWFGVRNDGIACEDNINNSIDYITRSGGTLFFPVGIINFGRLRKTVSFFPGIKNFVIRGQGAATVFSFENIDPPARSSNKNWVFEKALLTFNGISNSSFIGPFILENFTIDYSKQRNKGGTDLDSLSDCHPTPHSAGTTAIFVSYCLNPVFKNIYFSNIYGNGIYCRRSLKPLAENNFFRDVSANQIVARNNRMDQDCAGGAIFYWSCYGGIIRDCTAWNTRKYTVDFNSPDNGQSLKGTLCGYIGFWCEYDIGLKGKDNTEPPWIDWLNIDKDRDNDSVSRGMEISNCLVYGYVIGIKGETAVDISIINNIVLNCYLPILCSGVRGIVQRNFTDMLECEDIKCPQGGLEQKRSHLGGITFTKDFNSNLSLEISHNYVRTSNYPAVITSRLNLKFLYNYIDLHGKACFFASSGKGRLFGLEMIGNVFYFNKTANPVPSRLDFNSTALFENNTFIINCEKGLEIDFRSNPNSENISFIRNTIIGPLIIKSDTKLILDNNYFSNRGNEQSFFSIKGNYSRINNNIFECPRNFEQSLIELYGRGHLIQDNLFVVRQGKMKSNKLVTFLKLKAETFFIEVNNNRVSGNNDNRPFIFVEDCSILHAHNNFSDGISRLIENMNKITGPVFFSRNQFKQKITNDLLFEEPNLAQKISSEFNAFLGERIYYILPQPNGREGIVMTSAGWKEFGLISN